MPNQKITRDDVAKLAGVSPAVVSYVINASKNVSEEKKKAVLAAIKELRYQPNLQARSLKTRQSMQIAFVCDNLRNDWMELPEKMLFERGYYVSHCYSRDGDDFIQMLISRQFDGIFMMSNRYSTEQLRQISDSGIPIVLYKTREYGELGDNVAAVVPDLYSGVMKSVNYLVMHGHKRIALLLPMRYRSSGIDSNGYRERAYVQALRDNGLEPDDALIFSNTEASEHFLAYLSDMMIGESAGKRPTAFLAGNDYMAAEVMKSMKTLGLRIPEDVAVIGTDNTYLTTMLSPTLTSIDFSKDEFARKLTDTMLALIRGEHCEDTFIRVGLAIRESA
ncbi:MAG: LacI family DNA-binding transcriptional regulator [Oscillospiraceae bacterium]|nr:LacI family DNA-binding transcriptional regulator [Oscillospiraceae bacterium]